VSAVAILIALSEAIRPTSLAATYQLLSSPRASRLLAVFVAAGFAFTTGLGILIVSILHAQVDFHSPAHRGFDVGLGVLALGAAAAYWTGHVPGRRRGAPGSGGESRIKRRLHNPTYGIAALAGIASHFPGIFYLMALDEILATDPGPVDGILQVVVYNLIWYSAAIASLVVSMRRPALAQDMIGRIRRWSKAHERVLVVTALVVLGLYFLVKAALSG
jgi:Sap, sulfolipid-1-addressing protein